MSHDVNHNENEHDQIKRKNSHGNAGKIKGLNSS